jgi:hypothetical protein
VHDFAQWLAQTSLSVVIQTHEWVIPTVQSIHIVAIAIVVGSLLMIQLRVLGWAARDQTLTQTTDRFGPWLAWAFGVLLLTGAVMVVGEPVRELLALSFWLKMALVAIGVTIAMVFHRSVRRDAARWEAVLINRRSTKAVTFATLLVWVSVVVLGRLIAYDYVWGSWSASLRGQ